MAKDKTFTAEQVRDAAEYLVRFIAPNMVTPEPALQWGAMLDAFAQRLEQDEAQGPRVYLAKILDPNDWSPDKAFEQMLEDRREEGRREVLREIAALKPNVWESSLSLYCLFCGSEDLPPMRGMVDHKPTCLWLRAQEAVKP